MEAISEQVKPKPLLLRSEVKAIFRVSARTVDRMVERGTLPAVKSKAAGSETLVPALGLQ